MIKVIKYKNIFIKIVFIVRIDMDTEDSKSPHDETVESPTPVILSAIPVEKIPENAPKQSSEMEENEEDLISEDDDGLFIDEGECSDLVIEIVKPHEDANEATEETDKVEVEALAVETNEQPEDVQKAHAEKPADVDGGSSQVRIKYLSKSPLKYMHTSPRRIVKAYKRRAMSQQVPVEKFLKLTKKPDSQDVLSDVSSISDYDCEELDSSDDVSFVKPIDPLQDGKSPKLDDKLEKLGTTMKRISAPAAVDVNRVLPVPPINPSKVIFYPRTPVAENLKAVSNILPPMKIDPFWKINNGNKLSGTTIRNTLVKKILKNPVPVIRKLHASATPNFNFTNTPKPAGVTLKLQKLPAGNFTIVNHDRDPDKKTTLPNPETFPKAIHYPEYETKNDETKNDEPRLTTYNLSTFAASLETERESVPSPEDLFTVETIDNEVAKEDSSRPLIQRRDLSPESVKYVIPQNMIASSTDKIKEIAASSHHEAEVTTIYPDGDMFVVETEEEKRPPSPLNKNRRKTALVPKEDDIHFEDNPSFQMLQRPQENLDLIEMLANYRVLVCHMLKKLEMPQIDLNEESDDYINMYKILRK